MATAPNTIMTIALTGQTEFDIPFEYIARKFVRVSLIGQDRRLLVLNNDYRFLSPTKISLSINPPAEYTFLELRRVTSATDRVVSFYDGSVLRANDLNVSQVQTIHIAEEARDAIAADGMGITTDGNLDARNRRIVNLAEAQAGSDAVTLGQVISMENSAYNSALNSAASAQESADYALESARNAAMQPNVKTLGAVGNGVTDDTAAFRAADALNTPHFVPAGSYKVSAPAPSGLYFGYGLIVVEGVTFKLDYSIPTRINTGTPIDPSEPETVTQDGRYFNLFIGQGTAANVTTTDARASTVVGYDALSVTSTPIRLTGFGKQVFHKATDGYTCDAFGSDALGWGDKMERCTALGSNALKWAGTTDPVGTAHDFWKPYNDGTYTDFIDAIHLSDATRWPAIRTYLGSSSSPSTVLLPTKRSDVAQSIAVGRNALLHALKSDSNVAIGVNSLAHMVTGQYNVGVGTRALRDCVNGVNNTAIGNNAAALNITGGNNVAIGFNSLYSGSHTVGNVAVGSEAALSLTGTDVAPASSPTARRNVYIGTQSGKNATDGSFNTAVGSVSLLMNTGTGNVALGAAALTANTTGSFNVSVGYEALKENDVGSGCVAVGQYALLKSKADNNTAVGQSALRYTATGGSHVGYTNCTGIGADSRVSGNNQVQLGDSATTTYVFGTVQNRSDARDKRDVTDTSLDIEFIRRLRPVEGRWDLRDDYVTVDEDGARKVSPRDGSKARNRKHQWFIAQEVKELCDELGVDFGGYQDHSIHEGDDVLTLGYDEFIPPTVRAVQQCWDRLDALEARIAQLESK